MSVEFNQLLDQVQHMGRYLGNRWSSAGDKLALALERFYNACDLAPIHERVRVVRGSGVSGYRGAAPLPTAMSEIVCGVGDLPYPPETGAIIAADGSQIYPDPHAPALYYLINIGVFTYFYANGGIGRLPDQETAPVLYYTEKMLEDKDGRAVNNQTVNARRTVMEMQALAKRAWALKDREAHPIIALHDGGLLKFFGATEIAGAGELERDYFDALRKLYDAGAVLAGYPGQQRATFLISLLHLLALPLEDVNDANLKTNGDLEGLSDARLYEAILQPGQRSALMTQNSPQNFAYKQRLGDDFEIAFFYVNVSETDSERPQIARVDVPMWVASHPARVDALHALIVQQSHIQGRKRYPYALTRADELAVVSGREREQVGQLIRIAMLENGLMPEESEKLQTKSLARGSRQQYRLRG